jgi:hypothetical protein
MISTVRSSALAVSALVIAAAALAFDAGRTSGAASCQTHQHQHQPTLTRASL